MQKSLFILLVLLVLSKASLLASRAVAKDPGDHSLSTGLNHQLTHFDGDGDPPIRGSYSDELFGDLVASREETTKVASTQGADDTATTTTQGADATVTTTTATTTFSFPKDEEKVSPGPSWRAESPAARSGGGTSGFAHGEDGVCR